MSIATSRSFFSAEKVEYSGLGMTVYGNDILTAA